MLRRPQFWFWSLFGVMLLSLVLRIWSVQSVRAEVAEYYALRAAVKTKELENTQLSLERSVLLRAARLRAYGEQNLQLVRASDLRRVQ